MNQCFMAAGKRGDGAEKSKAERRSTAGMETITSGRSPLSVGGGDKGSGRNRIERCLAVPPGQEVEEMRMLGRGADRGGSHLWWCMRRRFN